MCIGEEGRIILFFSFISYRIVTILLLLSTYVYRLYILYIYVCVYLFFLLFFSFCKLPVDYFHVDREDFQTVC